MPNIYAYTGDGYLARFNQGSWSAARASSVGTNVNSTGTSNSVAISASKTSARGGGSAYHIYRSFFVFDTSNITIDVASATLKIRGIPNVTGDQIALKSNSDIETLGTDDFNAIEGWNITTDGSGGGSNLSNVTKYSGDLTTWNGVGYNDFTLTSNALHDMRADDKIYIAIINSNYDLIDIEPTGFSDNRSGLRYANYTGTGSDPYIDYTLENNKSIFFGCNF